MYTSTKTIGIVYDVSWHKPKDYAQWGIYTYKIAWAGTTNLQKDEWAIIDLIKKHITYIGNGNAMKVLYGKV